PPAGAALWQARQPLLAAANDRGCARRPAPRRGGWLAQHGPCFRTWLQIDGPLGDIDGLFGAVCLPRSPGCRKSPAPARCPPLVEAPRAQVVLDLGDDRLDHTGPWLTSGGVATQSLAV